MSFRTIPIPNPIRFGPGLRFNKERHVIVEHKRRRDVLDLTTCECHVARVLDGIRYDTEAAHLVVSASSLDGDFYFNLRQIFRSFDHLWFAVQVQWSFDSGQCNDNLIVPIPDERVLPALRQILRPDDCRALLRDWYAFGWIPRNDAFAQRWAEDILSADDCQDILDSFNTIPATPGGPNE